MTHLGTAADTGDADSTVISRVEQLVGCGHTLITFGCVGRRFDGTFTALRGVQTVRLTTAEREALIGRLAEHRTPAPATALTSTNGG